MIQFGPGVTVSCMPDGSVRVASPDKGDITYAPQTREAQDYLGAWNRRPSLGTVQNIGVNPETGKHDAIIGCGYCGTKTSLNGILAGLHICDGLCEALGVRL